MLLPENVYHYTSPSGALGILSKKTLWFTDCQYLNDIGEAVYIREPLKEAYAILSRERSESDPTDKFLDSFFSSPYEDMDFGWITRTNRGKQKYHRGFPPRFRYYILCASKNDDTASMWHYYVKDGKYQGYNLGLDVSVIREWFQERENRNLKLIEGNIIYRQSDQINRIYCRLKDLLSQYDSAKSPLINEYGDDPAIEEFQNRLFEYINEQKLFFKNPSFESEQEYRFILKVRDGFADQLKGMHIDYRIGDSGIITPYIEWSFGSLKDKLLRQITLSPMIESELAQESFKRFLAQGVYHNIEIKPSRIKLRF